MPKLGSSKYDFCVYGVEQGREFFQAVKDSGAFEVRGTVVGRYMNDGHDRRGGVANFTHKLRGSDGRFVKGHGTLCMRVNVPTNPQTVPQQAWRSTFQDGIDLWATMSDAEKAPYVAEASKHPTRNAHNVWMSWYLRTGWRL